MSPRCAGVPACSQLCVARPRAWRTLDMGHKALSWGFLWPGDTCCSQLRGHWSQRAEGTAWAAPCPCRALQPPLGPRAWLALTSRCAQLPTGRRGLPSPPRLSAWCPGPCSSCRSLCRGACATSPRSSSCRSAWIPLSIQPHRGKAAFYGRRPTPFLSSRAPSATTQAVPGPVGAPGGRPTCCHEWHGEKQLATEGVWGSVRCSPLTGPSSLLQTCGGTSMGEAFPGHGQC